MSDTIELPRELVCHLIEEMRYWSMLYRWDHIDHRADELQFGLEADGEFDGHRCRICGRLAGGDRTHKCWKENGKMNEENKTKIKEAVAAAGKDMEGKMPADPRHPAGRNPYAHLWKTIKDAYGKTYSDLPDNLALSVLTLIESERRKVVRSSSATNTYDAHSLERALSAKVFRVTLKDPDGFYEGIRDAVAESVADVEDDEEREALEEVRRKKFETALEKWVDYSEYVTLEFDLTNGTARVVPWW
jgi:hypothetical protein